jgi:SpoVK/Ycf46/Vps4 family AAA+-type ATPase
LDPSIKYNINMTILHNIKEPLEELNNMIGMKELKNNIVDQILYFAQELHKSKCSDGDFMHTVIYGAPGTGKTEIAKIMGKIYSKLGILTKGTFKKVTRSDLIAGYLGQTALKTRDVIKEAIGGVLFIDEAYALGNHEKRDSFSKECIDTLCEALSDNKENLMVIIAGYEKELKDCFFNYNEGLDSRFTWRFKTDDYTGEDLYKIFIKKVNDIGWELHENSKIDIEWFKKNKEYFKFYGRDIETILAKTKIAHSKRVFCKPESEKRKIILKDLDKGFEIYLKNDDVKNRRNEIEMKKYLYNTLYT